MSTADDSCCHVVAADANNTFLIPRSTVLDMHRAANQQMKISMGPTDMMQDVLEPVRAILHMRGNKVDVIAECPSNLVVMSDRLRLKQIVLNLGKSNGTVSISCLLAAPSHLKPYLLPLLPAINSTKFVFKNCYVL